VLTRIRHYTGLEGVLPRLEKLLQGFSLQPIRDALGALPAN
jgi:hypothetical protein